MKIQVALAIVVLAFALSQAGIAQSNLTSENMPLNPANAAVPSASNPPILPPSDSSPGSISGTTQPLYTPLYESTAPTYAIPPQNTPPPTTPGENP